MRVMRTVSNVRSVQELVNTVADSLLTIAKLFLFTYTSTICFRVTLSQGCGSASTD